jgi:putative oxidoreductase
MHLSPEERRPPRGPVRGGPASNGQLSVRRTTRILCVQQDDVKSTTDEVGAPPNAEELTVPIVRPLSRALLAAPFVVLGYEAAADPGGRVELAAAMGVPDPELAVRFNGAAMTIGGVALGLGLLPRAAAVGLAASLVPTTLAGHAFWQHEDPTTRKTNRIQFLKNLGLLGGLVAVAAATEARSGRGRGGGPETAGEAGYGR